MELPKVTNEPGHHSHCCLSISTRLLDVLTETFNSDISDGRNGLVLSIGSGSGLLEGLLLSRWSSSPLSSARTLDPNLQIEGVEIRSLPPVNKYLPDENSTIVKGSWDAISSRTRRDVRGLMFVYPRSPALVERYVRDFASAVTVDARTMVEEEEKNARDEEKEWERSGTRSLRVVVWLGHRSDWPDFEPCFAGVPGFGSVEVVGDEDAGLVEYEMMTVMRREAD